MMLSLPPEVFAMMFGLEYLIEPGRAPGMRTAWYLDDDAADSHEAPAVALSAERERSVEA